MPIAIGAVTDFGASDATVCGDAPSSHARPTAVTSATVEPTTSAPTTGSPNRRSAGHARTSGTASPTTAGPSRKWTNCAPAKNVGYVTSPTRRVATISTTAISTGLASGCSLQRA